MNLKSIGDKKKDGWYDPNLAERIAKEEPNETAKPQIAGSAKPGIYIATARGDGFWIAHLNVERGLKYDVESLDEETAEEKGVLTYLVERESKINALCVHSGTLYDATSVKIRESFSDRLHASMNGIRALCSHNGTLYHAAGREVFSGKETKAIRNMPVYALAVHDGKLFDASGDHFGQMKSVDIRETLRDPKGKERPFANTGEWVYTMTSCANSIYINELQGIAWANDRGKIERIERIRRGADVIGLCTWDGLLHDASGTKIHNTKTGEVLISMQEKITAICSCEGKP